MYVLYNDLPNVFKCLFKYLTKSMYRIRYGTYEYIHIIYYMILLFIISYIICISEYIIYIQFMNRLYDCNASFITRSSIGSSKNI